MPRSPNMQAVREIPEEILYSILSHLDPLSLSAAARANRLFYRIATSPSLWRPFYLLRWNTGHPERERRRGTLAFRPIHLAHRLQQWASRAKDLSAPTSSLPKAAVDPDEGPFGFLRLPKDVQSTAPSQEPDFYRAFLERMRIDQEVLDLVYDQVEATHSRIPAAEELSARFGDDAKDILSAVVSAQLSGPSSTLHGRPTAPEQAREGSGLVDRSLPCLRRQDGGAYRLRAYDAHLPTTLRSESHHLVILHHARELLEHLQRIEAMRQLKQLDAIGFSPSVDQVEQGSLFPVDWTEKAVSLLSMFRGGELYQIREELDVWAAACDLYLQSARSDLYQKSAEQASTGGVRPVETARALALAIGDFLKDHGFRGARVGLFQDLDNHFLHRCLSTNRETIPLSLTTIYCAIANRLGLRASLCNFPTRILAVINFSTQDHTFEDDRFWLDVAEYTGRGSALPMEPSFTAHFAPILTRSDLQDWTDRLNLAHRVEFIKPAAPAEMVVRAARNIVASVQRAQILPHNARSGEGARAQANAAELRNEVHSEAGRSADGRERPDRLFLKLRYGWVPTEEQEGIYPPQGGKRIAPPEDWSTWSILERFRAESLALSTWTGSASSPTSRNCWDGFATWIEARRADDDWDLRLVSQRARASQWSEHEQQASMYAAVNGFVRLTDELGDRGADWMAGLVQSYFPLDVGQAQIDFLGVPAASSGFARPATTVDPGGTRSERQENHSESGSDLSFEDSFSGHEESGSAAAQRAGSTYIRNAGVRFLISNIMDKVRNKDAEAPKVNRRSGEAARIARAHRRSAAATAALPFSREYGGEEHGPVDVENGPALDEEDEEDPVTFRVGTLFRHRTYGYLACILGWDPHCAAPEEWIMNMGIDQLPPPAPIPSSSAPWNQPRGSGDSSGTDEFVASPTSPLVRGGFKSTRMKREKKGGRHQPFYHSQVADGTRRYVAEVNVRPVAKPSADEARQDAEAIRHLLKLRGLGEYFRCFDQRAWRMRRNRECQEMFPDDWSDDEDEDEEDWQDEQAARQQHEQQYGYQQQQGGALQLHLSPPPRSLHAETQVERLSEDGSW
ncbi:hypothetical protein ACQY0O_006795 [Thecaphora frezii]